MAIEADGYEPVMRLVNITNKPHTEAQRIDFLLRPTIADEEEQVVGMEGPIDDDVQLSPEQAEQLIELISYARQRNVVPVYNH